MHIFQSAEILVLITAMIHVESGGDPNAIGDNGQAHGVLQIHQIYLDDIIKNEGTEYTLEDIKDEAHARMACWEYLHHWCERLKKDTGREPTLEDAARIHNGGPNGYYEECTEQYWGKVQLALEAINSCNL